MELADIQKEVVALPADQRRVLTAWMVSEFPALRVEDLMAAAAGRVREGSWQPEPPSEENIPKGKTLEHALRVAAQLGLLK